VFSNGKGVTGTINGGSGSNELDYAAYTTVVSANLASHTATGTGGFANIETLVGGAGANTLVGANATNTWSITGTNAGNVAGVTFSAFPNLTGGTGMDVFKFSAGKGVTGAIHGGGGGDWLDYASYTTAVTVNLATGTATGVGGGVTNVPNVRGGQGTNTLTGNSQGNILIGGAGTNIITGGSGRSILTGDTGTATVKGGAADDIVIGGYTNYDTRSTANDAALEAILAEWRSADSYTTRISKMKAGVTGGYKLVWGTTVHDNLKVDTLTGGGGMNWFFKGTKDTITDYRSGEQIN
jgi:Ca2+-binding RTX toxin-like protein